MRFGCCGSLLATQPDKTGIEFTEYCKACGYDYMELPLAEMMALDEDAFQRLKERVKNSGLDCEVSNNFYPASIRLTGPDADMGKITDYTVRALARARELGVQIVVFGSGGAKRVPEGFDHEQAFGQLVEITKMIAGVAEENEITIALEPMRMPDCNIINSFREAVQLARAVNHDRIRVLLDYYHFLCQREPYQNLLEDGKQYLAHVHFCFPNFPEINGTCGPDGIREIFEPELNARGWWRTYPSLTDGWNYDEIIAAIQAVGYDQRISLEAPVTDHHRQIREALDFLREKF